MKKKNEETRQAESLEQSLEVLFGTETDLTDAELDEELKAYGIDPTELKADVYKQLSDHAKYSYRTIDKNVPIDLERALRALRPPNAADRAKTLAKSAEDLVGNFLDVAKSTSEELLNAIQPIQTRPQQVSFRNKKDLSEADKALLQSEQEDVDGSSEF